MERDRKKEKKKVKGSDGAGSKKGAQGAAASMVAGVPAAMPVSLTSIYFTDNYLLATEFGFIKAIFFFPPLSIFIYIHICIFFF